MDPLPNANVPIDTVLLEPTFLLAIVPVPDKLKVCEPTKLACVAKSDATAFVVASAVSIFQSTIDQIVILAVLMPIVASMGGVAGNQTLILVIRGIAMEKIQSSNAMRLLTKEMMVSLVNGTFWAIIVSCFSVLLFQTTWEIGIIVGVSMLLNIFASAIAGVTIPFLLKRIGIDPALASGVMMTTLTDVLGFVTFLGLATLLLL